MSEADLRIRDGCARAGGEVNEGSFQRSQGGDAGRLGTGAAATLGAQSTTQPNPASTQPTPASTQPDQSSPPGKSAGRVNPSTTTAPTAQPAPGTRPLPAILPPPRPIPPTHPRMPPRSHPRTRRILTPKSLRPEPLRWRAMLPAKDVDPDKVVAGGQRDDQGEAGQHRRRERGGQSRYRRPRHGQLVLDRHRNQDGQDVRRSRSRRAPGSSPIRW